MVLYLLERTPTGAENRIALPDKAVITVGRSSSKCDVAVSGFSVSTKHCRLDIESGRIFVSDLDSSNGTFVNGKKVEGRVELFKGDVLRLADHPVRLTGEDAPVRPGGTDSAAKAPVPSNTPLWIAIAIMSALIAILLVALYAPGILPTFSSGV